jgi:restriction system protein
MKEPATPTTKETPQPKMWGIHSRDDALFRHENFIAIGWKEMGDLSKLPDKRDAFKTRFAQVYPDAKKAAIPTAAGMLYRFFYELQIGDYIVYPSKHDRKINLGIVEGSYIFNPEQHYSHQRKVKWIKQISRDLFSPAALYEVGSAMTFFAVSSNANEFRAAINPVFKLTHPVESDQISTPVNPDSVLEATKDFLLKELSTNFKGFALEEFVANLLQAMGYRTILSKKGGDNGIDIIAYKDELPPRILVQVKSKDGDINRSPVSQLHGDLKTGDYGLFVTLSNFTPNAIEFLKETPRVKAINGSELAELVLKYYDKLDEQYRKIIPLKMVYVPAPPDDSDSDSD